MGKKDIKTFLKTLKEGGPDTKPAYLSDEEFSEALEKDRVRRDKGHSKKTGV